MTYFSYLAIRRVPQTTDAHLRLLVRRRIAKASGLFCIAALAGSAVVYAPLPVKIAGGAMVALTLPLGAVDTANAIGYVRRRRYLARHRLRR